MNAVDERVVERETEETTEKPRRALVDVVAGWLRNEHRRRQNDDRRRS